MTPKLDTLSEAATAAGLIDPDLLKLARTDVAPQWAIEDLKRQFPGAFKLPFDARTATQAECDAWLRDQQQQEHRRYAQQVHDRQWAEIERRDAEVQRRRAKKD